MFKRNLIFFKLFIKPVVYAAGFISVAFFVSCNSKNVIDSNFAANFEKDKYKLVEELDSMVSLDQSIRFDVQLEESSKRQKMIEVQETNTKRIVEIIKKYGFPSVERLEQGIPVWIILQHASLDYREELLELLEKEFKAKRIPNNEYQMIIWHLNGRKGLPIKMEGIEINDLR